MLKQRTTCRLCGSDALSPILSLGEQYIASNFETTDEFPPVERRIPLDLIRCDPIRDEDACGVAQLRHTVPPDLMYSSYGYRSGINATMTEHLTNLARYTEKMVPLESGDVVVDIGANDGTLLSAYTQRGIDRVGFEPSNVAPEVDPPEFRYVRDYFSATAFRTVSPESKAKIVTSIAMFYDLEDPHAFVSDIAEILHPEGVWVVELAYLPTMIERTLFDTICHEHLFYYALGPLERLIGSHGLRVIDLELNDINGGSIRLYVASVNSTPQLTPEARGRLHRQRRAEFEMRLESPDPYDEFRHKVEVVRDEVAELVSRLKREGKTIFGYGASTKGNVILQYCGVTNAVMDAIADRNPAKWGTKTIGTNIPIVSEEEMRARRPDYLLVLPWHFLPEFVQRERDFLLSGGHFILPLPEVRVIGKESLASEE